MRRKITLRPRGARAGAASLPAWPPCWTSGAVSGSQLQTDRPALGCQHLLPARRLTAQGKGYRLLDQPGEIEAMQYPPLVPLIVAAHQRVPGTPDPLKVGSWLR
jgi:hypothetical protein